MQRVAIFGGTGMTGQCVVDHAVERGLKVRMMYRNESTVPERFNNNESIQLVKGDVQNLEDCKEVLKGVDGVCVILGTRNQLEPTTVMSKGTENIIAAMKAANLRKFSAVMSSFLFRADNDVPERFRPINDEHKRMLELSKNSGLDYIAILPPHISNEPAGKHLIKIDGSPGQVVSKIDLANFIVDSLDKPEYYGKVVGIAKVVAA